MSTTTTQTTALPTTTDVTTTVEATTTVEPTTTTSSEYKHTDSDYPTAKQLSIINSLRDFMLTYGRNYAFWTGLAALLKIKF